MFYLFDRWEVLRFFFFNLRWWIEEYKFDGYRFDGVILMLYYIYGMGRFLVYLGNDWVKLKGMRYLSIFMTISIYFN